MTDLLPIFAALREHGHLNFTFTVVVGVFCYELIRRRAEFSAALLHLLNKWVHFCSDAIAFQRAHTVKLLSDRISQIYTILFALAPLQPLRAMVAQFTHYPKQKFWRLNVVHEADFGASPLKSSLQNIELDAGTVQAMVTDVLRDGEKYVGSLAATEPGPLKDLLSSFDVRSYLLIYLGSHERRYYSLLITFSRAKPLTNAEKGTCRLAAQNIKNEIFSDGKRR